MPDATSTPLLPQGKRIVDLGSKLAGRNSEALVERLADELANTQCQVQRLKWDRIKLSDASAARLAAAMATNRSLVAISPLPLHTATPTAAQHADVHGMASSRDANLGAISMAVLDNSLRHAVGPDRGLRKLVTKQAQTTSTTATKVTPAPRIAIQPSSYQAEGTW